MTITEIRVRLAVADKLRQAAAEHLWIERNTGHCLCGATWDVWNNASVGGSHTDDCLYLQLLAQAHDIEAEVTK